MFNLNQPLTHPESAWLIHLVNPALVAAALLVGVVLLRNPTARFVQALRSRRARAARLALPPDTMPDLVLLWAPETMPAGQFALVSLGVAGLLSVAASLVLPVTVAITLGTPLAALVWYILERVAQARYVASLDRELTPAVGRLGALLRAGIGLRPALDRLVGDLPPGPLRDEWAFLVTRQGMPLSGGGIATTQQVAAALADQTPSRRHGAMLNHLSASVGQPQEVLARRCEAAYAALQGSDRRRDEALTELAQMRYSGLAVGLAGVAMASYLAWTQWERMVAAYSTTLGAVVGVVVLFALGLPIAGGVLLTRVEDSDY